MTGKSRRRNRSQTPDLEALPQNEEVSQRGAHEIRIPRPSPNGESSGATGSNAPVGQAGLEAQSGLRAYTQKDGPSDSGENNQPGDRSTPSDTAQPKHFIGDFDDSANALWSLHVKEAKSYDETRIQSLKDDMDGVLIFAGLFSATLVSFIIDKIHDLQVDPAKQAVYYQQQNVALLAQISQQVSTITPQVSIPSSPPLPYPDFSPQSSDIRVNAFWFMSLVFSLSAALLATLVQQWVRDYMHVFQRYSNPLKSARLRQYLYEGAEGWYMPVVAESVPGLVHVSLFLFFVGLGDSLLNLNTTIGIATIVPITVCGLLYVLSMFAPIVNPQSPFRNPFSGLIWYLWYKIYPRSYFDRASNTVKSVSSKMSEGQVQLAMEENDERKGRDIHAIRWLIDNSTEDDEMESFVMAIPGTFTSKWGIEVWKNVSEIQHEDATSRPNDRTVRSQMAAAAESVLPHHGSSFPQSIYHPRSLLRPLGRILGVCTTDDTPRNVTATGPIPHLSGRGQIPNNPHATEGPAIRDLCERVRHLLNTCNNRNVFANVDLWRKRARGCVETIASLVFYSDVKLELFEDLGKLLNELGTAEIRDLLAAGSHGPFLTRWTCLSLVVVTRGISSHDRIKLDAQNAIDNLSRFRMEDDGKQSNNDENALKNARRIDNHFETARQFYIYRLRRAFRSGEAGKTEEQAREVLERHEADISTLDLVALVANDMVYNIDNPISWVNRRIQSVSSGLITHLPGVTFDQFDSETTNHFPPTQFFNFPVTEEQAESRARPMADARHRLESAPFTPQFLFLSQRLRFLCSHAPKLKQGNKACQEAIESLEALWDYADHGRSVVHQLHLMERQLWRLQDLRDGGGFGFSVELFFLSLAPLLSTASSQDTHSSLYIRTFKAITFDWRKYKDSIGTQRVILNLVCDVAIPGRGTIFHHSYPEYITTELLELLGNMVGGKSGSHIDDAMKELDAVPLLITEPHPSFRFRVDAVNVISRSQASTNPHESHDPI